MACLLKIPAGESKGVVTFTTQERDFVIRKDPDVRAAIEALRARWVVGLHHNWHDYAFDYDPLFNFSMAGEGDLRELKGRAFPLIPLDACNFAPACFRPGNSEKFWDLLVVSRAVGFKSIPDLFGAVRALYDRGLSYRVLHLCPVSPNAGDVTEWSMGKLRADFEALFSADERKRFTLLTMDFDYPFPLDLETLALYYRSSRVFAHFAPDERRSRVAGYAWASGLPVVASAPVGSLLPARLRHPPNYFEVDDCDFESAIVKAVVASKSPLDVTPLRDVVSEEFTKAKLANLIDKNFPDVEFTKRAELTGLGGLGIRLGRHHGLNSGVNGVHQSVLEFARSLTQPDESQLVACVKRDDPEFAWHEMHKLQSRVATR